MSLAMHRFIVRASMLAQDAVTLDTARAHQIAVVLRMQPGDEITLVAGGDEAVAVLALPLLRGDRSEEVVEAVTQLGVVKVLPYVSTRSVVRALGDAKRERWERIAREAAETARRGDAPGIGTLRTWDELFEVLPRPIVVAWEGEREVRLRDALPRDAASLSLVIGPEGGLADEEIALARSRDAIV